MKKSLFKSISLYLLYRKILNNKRTELESKFNSRVDKVYRIYTVLNLPNELFEEPYNIRKQDIDALSSKYISEFSAEVSKYLNSIGLTELYELYDIRKVDKFSYLIVVGFSLFRTDKFTNNLYFRWIPISILLSVFVYLIYKLFS
jgi:hypothetical protein